MHATVSIERGLLDDTHSWTNDVVVVQDSELARARDPNQNCCLAISPDSSLSTVSVQDFVLDMVREAGACCCFRGSTCHDRWSPALMNTSSPDLKNNRNGAGHAYEVDENISPASGCLSRNGDDGENRPLFST